MQWKESINGGLCIVTLRAFFLYARLMSSSDVPRSTPSTLSMIAVTFVTLVQYLTHSLHGLTVCCTGFEPVVKAEIRDMVRPTTSCDICDTYSILESALPLQELSKVLQAFHKKYRKTARPQKKLQREVEDAMYEFDIGAPQLFLHVFGAFGARNTGKMRGK